MPRYDLSQLDGNSPLDLNALRARLAKMSDAELRGFGKAASYMCSPKANLGEPPKVELEIQLEEARAEWLRRHPRKEKRQ